MRDSRRMKRMERNNKKSGGHGLGINLIPMMDILCVLVFFLLFHSFNSTLPDAQLTLPASIAETKPRETVTIVVSPQAVMVQGEPVANTPELLEDNTGIVSQIRDRLEVIERNIAETGSKTFEQGKEVTLLADKTIPFKVLKKIMSTCTAAGYGRISLAVMQKEAKIEGTP
jgi:biopolymer transport protein TolR